MTCPEFPGKQRLRPSLNAKGQPRKRKAHKQSPLEAAARDHNWLLGRLRAAEIQYRKALYAAMEYADAGYVETCVRNGLTINRSKFYVFERAIRSLSKYARGRVSDRFAEVKRSELSRHEIVEPTQDFSISKEQ